MKGGDLMNSKSAEPVTPEKTRSASRSASGPVFKFGGTSMGTLERIEHVANLCIEKRPSAVVVSAMAGETNRLVSMAKHFTDQTDSPEYDLLVASGEQVSVALLSFALRKRGLKPVPMLAAQAGILTDDLHSRATIQSVNKDAILKHVEQGCIPVIAGFQGITQDGMFTSLGRGGSDTSAVAIAAGIGASECVIYTDVDGVFSADPRVCPDAHIIRRIRHEEMLEMASQGSKVLHIRSVQLAAKWGIRLFVKNTFSNDEGTEMIADNEPIEGELVTGVAHSSDEAWFSFGPVPHTPTTLADVFGALAAHGINVDIVNQDIRPQGLMIHFTVAGTDVPKAKEVLSKISSEAEIRVNTDVAKVSIVGVGMRVHAGVAARMFRALASAGIDVRLVTTSEIKVACLIDRTKLNSAVTSLHKEFMS
ncbi:MAG: aspartate kinase [Proteobacteria bacterium]|nr:aspartate kinase [Pseudomonadota bacterium]